MAQDNHHQTPDLSPRPVPEFAAVQRDVAAAEEFLAMVAEDAYDPRCGRARHLIAVDPETGLPRLGQIAALAYGYLFQPGSVSSDALEPLTCDMAHLIYEFGDNSGNFQSPLYFLEPTALLEVLETAIALLGLAEFPDAGRSTRQLARLARVDEGVIEQILERDGIAFQPYGVSLAEMAQMSPGDQLYWYRQWFVVEHYNLPEWLSQFPGFVGREAFLTADAA